MKIMGYSFKHDYATITYRLQSTDKNWRWTEDEENDKQNLAIEFAEACLDETSCDRLMSAEFKQFITGTQLKMEFMGSSPVTFKNGGS